MNSPQRHGTPAPSAGNVDAPPEASPRSVSSETLLQGGRELIIHHAGRTYRLCLTSRNKLILVA